MSSQGHLRFVFISLKLNLIAVFWFIQYQKMVNLRKNINVLAILLIPVYLLVMGNSILNRHTHVLPNGVVITHSHPFTDSKTGLPVKHNHSSNQILFFQLFTFDFCDLTPEVILAKNDIVLQFEIQAFYTDQISDNSLLVNFLRGPPSA